ncbi:MAG: hypothetical protein GY830_10980 [Bacteroidetes bacterium]|nr:hypothetical protein [Bacteroidota bacterium]
MNILLIGLGGFFGSFIRFIILEKFNTVFFPFGTLFVNTLGSFLLGLYYFHLKNNSYP